MNFEEFLKKNQKNYKIMCLKRYHGKTNCEIAKEFNLSTSRISERYHHFLSSLFTLYIDYLISQNIMLTKWDIFECYQSIPLSIAYLEKTYKKHLDAFRHGTPPIVYESHMEILPFKILTEETILEFEKYIVEAREKKKLTFSDIGKSLELTGERAKRIYNVYYQKKVNIAVKRIINSGIFSIEDYAYKYSHSPKKKWEIIVREYTEFVQDLID